VRDELVTGATQLVSMAIAGKVEGVGQRRPFDTGRRVELLDHGEEIGEELALL